MDTAVKIFDYKIKKRNKGKNFVVNLSELILTKKTLIYLELSMKYLDTLKNQPKNSNK